LCEFLFSIKCSIYPWLCSLWIPQHLAKSRDDEFLITQLSSASRHLDKVQNNKSILYLSAKEKCMLAIHSFQLVWGQWKFFWT
jgi:hypothetical protein